jgi:hypothetical protein
MNFDFMPPPSIIVVDDKIIAFAEMIFRSALSQSRPHLCEESVPYAPLLIRLPALHVASSFSPDPSPVDSLDIESFGTRSADIGAVDHAS